MDLLENLQRQEARHAAMTMLRDLIEIPERVHAGDFVLNLSAGIAKPTTVRDYVVTPQVADAFDDALGLIKSAVETRTSRAAYLDGSFGSGKSHFLAVLHAVLRQQPEAWSKDGLVPVVSKHAGWLRDRGFLLVPYHLMDATSLESAVLDGYVKRVRELHPDKPLPAVYRDDLLLHNARTLRTRMGDDAFIAALPESDDEWSVGWTPAALDAALAAPPGDGERQRLVGDLLASLLAGYADAVSGTESAYISLDEGLSVISRHAKDVLGYDAVVLLLDELVLWLGTRLADQSFVTREAQKISKLVESAETHRPAPIVSLVPRQRDLRELVGRDIAGAEATSLFDVLKYHDGRFDTVRLADGNLPAVVQARLLQPKDEQAADEINEAFERSTRTQPQVWETLLDSQGGATDKDAFRATYPFSPAFLHAMVDISGALQRERTALKLMLELLVDYRDTLRAGQLVPLGAMYDVLVAGGERPFTDKLREEFDQARRFYDTRLRPYLLGKHRLNEEQARELPSRHAFRADDLVVKTLLLAALVPNVPALRTLTASRLAALNHGSVASMIPGGERDQVADTLRDLSGEFGEIRVHGGDDPGVEIALIGVDTKAIVDQARGYVDEAAKRTALRDLLWDDIGVTDSGQLVTTHRINWRGTGRTVELVFGNVRDTERLADAQFEPDDQDALRVVIDYPFDDGNFGPADDRQRVERLRAAGKRAATLTWLPSFLSIERLADLEDLIAIGHVLTRNRLDDYAAHLSADDRDRARAQLANRHTALSVKIKEALKRAYGVASHDDADIGNLAEQHILTLQDGLEIRTAAGLGLGDALERMCHQLLDHLYPRHPNFDPDGRRQEIRLRELETVLKAIEEATLDPAGRVEIQRPDIPVLRRIANPLQLGTMHEAAFVLDQHWPLAINRATAHTHGDLPVSAVRDAVQAEQGGLPQHVVHLVVAAYALTENRTWVRAGQAVPPPRLADIRGDMALRAQRLPDEDAFEIAGARAKTIFDVDRQPVCRPRTVQAMASQVRRQAGEHRDAAEALVNELERHTATLGLAEGPGQQPGPPARLATARTVAGLLTELAGISDDTNLTEALARHDLPREGEVYRESLRQAGPLTQRLAGLAWQALDALPERAAHGPNAERAQVILDQLRSHARHDEQAAPLAPALGDAEKNALELLTETAPGPGTEPASGPAPGPAPEPGPMPSPAEGPGREPAAGTRTRRVQGARVSTVIDELRDTVQQRPEAEWEITWRAVDSGSGPEVSGDRSGNGRRAGEDRA